MREGRARERERKGGKGRERKGGSDREIISRGCFLFSLCHVLSPIWKGEEEVRKGGGTLSLK